MVFEYDIKPAVDFYIVPSLYEWRIFYLFRDSGAEVKVEVVTTDDGRNLILSRSRSQIKAKEAQAVREYISDRKINLNV